MSIPDRKEFVDNLAPTLLDSKGALSAERIAYVIYVLTAQTAKSLGELEAKIKALKEQRDADHTR